MSDVFRMTPEHDRIHAEIKAAETALEGYSDITQANPAEIERARAAVDAAVDADMPDQFYIGLDSYVRRYDRKAAPPAA